MRVFFALVALVATALIGGAIAPAAHAVGPNAVIDNAGCTSTNLFRNDDDSSSQVSLPFAINFFGETYDSLWVNNNGNVTFDGPLFTYIPFDITSTNHPIISPALYDVDTRGPGEPVRYGVISAGETMIGGHQAFCVNWVNVGEYNMQDRLNSFQLILIDRSDTGVGNFDIWFNYDRITTDHGTGLGIGYSNGLGDTAAFFELPGSRVSGYFLDTNASTGLIYNSQGTLQLGRYIFPVRGGGAPVGRTVTGDVTAAGSPLSGAPVQLCLAGGACSTRLTNQAGRYSFAGRQPGSYTVQAFSPSGASLGPSAAEALNLTLLADVEQDLALTPPPGAPPAGVSVNNAVPGTIPVVVVGRPFPISVTGCEGGAATYTIMNAYGGSASGSLTQGPAGTYTGMVTLPFTGTATVVVTIAGCPTLTFGIYIDPSGFVRNASGQPIVGATVTLYRSDDPAGPFEIVPDGDAIMSPANRSNPDLTDATGHFGWDTIAGYYKVRAEKAGCHALGNAAQSYAETAVLPVPPPVTDIDLRLDGPGCQSSDVVPPVIDVPDDITEEATGPDGAIVSYAAAAEDNVDGPVEVSCTPASGSLFALGATIVTCTAEDAAGNDAEESFTVNVVDTTEPELTVPADITVYATSPAGAVLTYSASASDIVDGSVVPACSPASVGTFAIGDTTVSCTAEDAAGNSSEASFLVHVRGAEEQLDDLIAASIGVGPGTSLADKARSTLASLEADDLDEACGTLQAYLNEVEAQTGRKVTAAQAEALTDRVNQIRAVLDC